MSMLFYFESLALFGWIHIEQWFKTKVDTKAVCARRGHQNFLLLEGKWSYWLSGLNSCSRPYSESSNENLNYCLISVNRRVSEMSSGLLAF